MARRMICFLLSAMMVFGMCAMAAPRVSAANDLTVSENGIALIKEFEGFSAKPYWDYGQWTVGYGTRAPAEHLERYQKEGISREEAEVLLRDFLTEYGEDVNNFANKWGLELTQGQFDALLSLSFNCGPNWMSDREVSTFKSAVIEGRTGNDFLFAMGQWSTSGGEVRGLSRGKQDKTAPLEKRPPSQQCHEETQDLPGKEGEEREETDLSENLNDLFIQVALN